VISYIDSLQDSLLVKIEKRLTPLNITAFNESVFRFFLIEAMVESGKFSNIQSEIDRIDISYMCKNKVYILELKFYTNPISIYPDKTVKKKGGPSKGNYINFCSQIKKMEQLKVLHDGSRIHEKMIFLLYQSVDHNGEKTKYNDLYERRKLRKEFPAIISTRNQKRILLENGIEFRTLLLKIR